MMRSLPIWVLLTVLPPQQHAEKPPVFEAAVEVVAVDVGVVDRNGRPVPDLGPGDFTVKVDGSPRRVVSAEFIPQTGGQEPAASPSSTHFSSNEGTSAGRLVLLAVDQGNIPLGGGRDVVQAAERLLDRLGPADRVGLLTLPGPDPRVEFTIDRTAVRAALERIAGRGRFAGRRVALSEAIALDQEGRDDERWTAAVRRECAGEGPGCPSDLESEARQVASDYRVQSTASLNVLASAFDVLKSVEGPKTMVLVSQGLGLPDAGSRAERAFTELRPLVAAAAAARVSLYVVKVRAGSLPDIASSQGAEAADDDRRLHSEGLEALATFARGTVFRGAPEAAFDRLAREISGYYLLGLEPGPRDRNGKDHEIQVTVTRPDVTVRARRSVVIPPTASGADEERALASLMRSPVVATGLPVRVTSFALRDPGGSRVRVLVAAEIGRPQSVSGIRVAYVLLDGKGKVAAQGSQHSREDAALIPGPLRFSTSLTVEPGLYSLRLAARDRSGRQGSVDHPVKAALPSVGPLAVSDLLLGPAPAAGGTFQPAVDVAVPKGPLVAYLELYGSDAAVLGRAAVSLEVATADDAPSLASGPARIVPTPDAGRRIAQGILGLEGLAPAAYVARAVITVDGSPVGAVSLPFQVTPPP